MSGDVIPARRPGAAAPSTAAGRRIRLATVVAVSCGIVAVGVTGTGLLVPAGTPTPWVRVSAAVVCVGAGGVLLRLDGAARGVTALAVVAGAAALTCLATLPASTVIWGSGHVVPPAGEPLDGEGWFGGRPGEADGGGGGSGRPGPITLPPGADVLVEGGDVVLGLPDGARIVIGQAQLGAPSGVPPAGTSLAVVDGVVTRGDGGPVGAGVPLGGATLERGDGSEVVVGDGTLLDVPPPVDGPPADGLDALLALLLASFAVLAFAPPLVRFAERHDLGIVDDPDPGPEPDDDVAPEPVAMEDGLAEVLRSMLADPDPRTAVIGAYGRLLTALAEAGAPRRDEEGPHEHLWRSLGPLGVRRQPLHRLAELFVLARFTPRPVTEAHRQAAIAALADAVGDLRLQAADVREAVALVGLAEADA